MNEFELQHLPGGVPPLVAVELFASLLYARAPGLDLPDRHALGSANINRRNYARSYFCVYVLAIILGVPADDPPGVLSGLTQSLNGTFA